MSRRTVAVLLAAFVVASCSSGDDGDGGTGDTASRERTNDGINALVASYDLTDRDRHL